MDAHGGIWTWLAVCAAGLAIGIGLFQLTRGGEDDIGEEANGASLTPTGLPATPSAFARHSLTGTQIRLYRKTASDLGLDWTVIAAADQIDGGASPAAESERVSAIGYTLQSFGAPDDYRVALEARDGTRGYARSVLRLAERYRSLDAGGVPPADLPLGLPADGPVIAAFGQRLGILHDGIDVDAPAGAPIRAAAAGLVLSTGFHRVFGETTCILHRVRHGSRQERQLTTCYGNQSSYETEAGARVSADEVIGRVGCTGTCVRPHVHFQVRIGAGQTAPVTDPAPFLAPNAVPEEAGAPLERPAS